MKKDNNSIMKLIVERDTVFDKFVSIVVSIGLFITIVGLILYVA